MGPSPFSCVPLALRLPPHSEASGLPALRIVVSFDLHDREQKALLHFG